MLFRPSAIECCPQPVFGNKVYGRNIEQVPFDISAEGTRRIDVELMRTVKVERIKVEVVQFVILDAM